MAQYLRHFLASASRTADNFIARKTIENTKTKSYEKIPYA